MITREDLDEQVQSLTQQGKFQTAADVIADWAYWDMIGRFEEPNWRDTMEPFDADARRSGPEYDDPTMGNRRTDDREAGGSMLGQLQDRMNEEFGEDGWKA